MILHTIVPLHLVLEGHDRQPQWVEVEVQGRTLLVEPVSAAHGRVVRLISSNPADYLRPEWQPGVQINYLARKD